MTIQITPVTEKALLEAIAAATPSPRTGAAFVSVDTRVLIAMLAVIADTRTMLRMTDPNDELFRDSGADCIQYLLENVAPALGMEFD